MVNMVKIPVEAGLIIAAVLFIIGLIGLVSRRNILFMLMSIEIMLSASGLAFIVGGSKWASPDGQIMFLFILAISAAEVSVGLSLLFLQDSRFKSLDPDIMSENIGTDRITYSYYLKPKLKD